jgi:hypothetical protein
MTDRPVRPGLSGENVQESRQSALEGAPQQTSSDHAVESAKQGGPEASQDRTSRDGKSSERPSAGTPDVERKPGSSYSQERGGNSEESLVQESTGAFKERP